MNEDSADIININVLIADRPYPLKIKKSEEEDVRNAAREINEKVKQFQQVYAAKDKQDYLAMSALMYAVQNIENQRKTISSSANFEEELSKLEQTLKR
ncbi:MAG: cell division protein ZapA (FtsZ GTPase activity inhibitor) [Chitinophagales bacterium]|jgi:cell division protein ZapA (FtsZ GTPase activity inhibitor)